MHLRWQVLPDVVRILWETRGQATLAAVEARLREALGVTCTIHLGASTPAAGPHLAFPIRSGDQTVGMLSVEASDAHTVSESDRALLASVADILGVPLSQPERDSDHADKFLDAIIENIPDMIFVKDAAGLAFKKFNRAGERLLGVAREALIGKNDYDLFPPEQAKFFQEKDRNTLNGKTMVEIDEEPIETATGRRWLHTKKVPVLDVDGSPLYLLGISEDITEKKADEEALRRLAALVDSSSDAIVSTSPDGQITTWNLGAEKLFGFRAEEIIGKHISALVPPSRLAESRAVTQRLKSTGAVVPYETVRRRKDGREVDVSISSSLIHDRAGEVIGISKIVRDITELKRAELAVVRARDVAEAANRELESFSYSVAHDLRAPLRAIDGFSQALLEDCAEVLNPEGRDHLDRVRKNAQHMAQLIDALLALSRMTRSEVERAPVDLSAIAQSAADTLKRASPQRKVEVTVQEGLQATGDARLLSIVFTNLLGNAWKFTAKQPVARIDVSCVEDNGRHVYRVRDNGAGFDMAFAGKLFGVFQRLHPVAEFEGTGVGLATVQRIIRRHGGEVWAQSSLGDGATFCFTLSETQSPSEMTSPQP
ncbi:MAG: PAS domain S-box protein [Sandaracinaceae bacterium]|nr:PAS domain S-box protein [Sandaracinaceae bacterium]